jgi:hypothetical protein
MNLDYLQQACEKCNNKTNKLIKYEHLVERDTPSYLPHREDLCAKCQSNHPCQYKKASLLF